MLCNEHYYTYFQRSRLCRPNVSLKTYGLQTHYPNIIKVDNVVSTIKKTIATEYKYIKKNDDTYYTEISASSHYKGWGREKQLIN